MVSDSQLLGSSSILELFNTNIDGLYLQTPFPEIQSHAIKRIYFMQHSLVDASNYQYPSLLGTAQLGVPGMKEHA